MAYPKGTNPGHIIKKKQKKGTKISTQQKSNTRRSRASNIRQAEPCAAQTMAQPLDTLIQSIVSMSSSDADLEQLHNTLKQSENFLKQNAAGIGQAACSLNFETLRLFTCDASGVRRPGPEFSQVSGKAASFPGSCR